ncbi:class I SAM-dependent methyltransferase [Enterococcus casseliflavus]|uniref:class I SAM-dependent methyltransferase n=1 Tax=Enterococcus casseliflavus TaxID=37734 RepID=UPI001883568E|nr:class I SAM-dependent methyltransferase [Enterococcus casseliflavus]MBE9908975.1 methyltransferase domain-containing protein [Enterococcus casseliflavus]
MEKLLELALNPEPFDEGTHNIWQDPQRSELVLKTHFDENIPGGSKSTTFIKETVEMLKELAPVQSFKNVLDLACGPGRYSEELAKLGYDVTGIDYNKVAIDYAIEEAKKKHLEIEYLVDDITNLKIDRKFDLILLIYHVYGSFDPIQRRKILESVYSKLNNGGLVVLDVLSESSYDNYGQNFVWGLSRKDNFFSNKKHLTLSSTLKYPNKVSLAKNVIVFGDGELVNYNYWNQHYSIEDLKNEVKEVGFNVQKVFADVNGGEYDPKKEEFAVILTKK